MKRAALVVLAAGAVFLAGAARADDAIPEAASRFYTTVVRPSAGGGLPDAGYRQRLAPLLTARLNKALGDAAAAEARFHAKNKASPPLLEGDIFSSLFEGPTGWKLGACQGDGKAARCAISLTRQDPGQKPVSWIDTLVLVNEGGWKVDDLAYDANFAFGNTGTLSQVLKMTLSEAR